MAQELLTCASYIQVESSKNITVNTAHVVSAPDPSISAYQAGVDMIHSILGRSIIEVVRLSRTKCHNCKFDEANKCSAGVVSATATVAFTYPARCPVCGGVGYENTENKTYFHNAVVNPFYPKTKDLDKFELSQLKTDAGLIKASVIMSDALLTGSDNKTIFEVCDYIVLNKLKYKVVAAYPLYFGVAYRYVVIAQKSELLTK